MNGLFLTAIVLYEAILKCSDSKYKRKRRKGISVTRHSRNVTQTTKKSFNFIESKNDTILSIEYWTLKQNNNLRDLHEKSKDNITLTTPL